MIKSIIIILILAAIIAGLGYGLYYFNFLNNNNKEIEEDEPIDISNDLESDISEDVNVINTEKGDKFSVVLESNPTTGYQWEITLDSEYIQLDDRNFVSEPSEGMVGVGGEETFNFTSLESGETEITFSYLRSWEKDIEPIQEKTYNVIIE